MTEIESTGLDFSSYIAERTENFTGRGWVFAEIDQWLADPGAPRVFIISGGPATGKTAIAACLTQVRPVHAWHFCMARRAATLDPLVFCRSLGQQLALRLPGFAETEAQVEQPIQISGHLEVGTTETGAQVSGVFIRHLDLPTASPEECFRRVLLEPLAALAELKPDMQAVIVVDALDEALDYLGQVGMIDLLSQHSQLPGDVRWLITSRPGPHLNRFRNASRLTLEDRDDLQAFIHHRLERLPDPESQREGFFRRDWVWQQVDRWLAKGHPPHYLLCGRAGGGKTSLIGDLDRVGRTPVKDELPHLAKAWIYRHYCKHGLDKTLDPLRFTEGLAKALAKSYEPFAQALAEIDPSIHIKVDQSEIKAENGAQVSGVVIHDLHIGDLNARVAFEHILRRPLERLCKAGLAEKLLIVVDGLDEAQGYSNNALAALIGHQVQPEAGLPSQVRWLLTSRPEPRVLHRFGQAALDLSDDPAGREDILHYAYSRLERLDESDRKELARQIFEAAKGSFLFARCVLDDVLQRIEQGQPWELYELPKDLGDYYGRFLRRELGEDKAQRDAVYRPLLGLLVVAQGSGLSRIHLAGALGKKKDDVLPFLTACAQYLEGPLEDGPFRIYHQSLREFLLHDTDFQVDLGGSHQRVAEYLLEAYEGEWEYCRDDYVLQYTPVHLIEAMRHLSEDEPPPVRKELAEAMRSLLQETSFWQVRESSDLLLGSLHGNAVLQAMLSIWSHHRQVRPILEPLLGVLVVACAPLTAEQLVTFSGLDDAQVDEGLKTLQPVLNGTSQATYTLFHESLRQYLAQLLEERLQDCHRQIATSYMEGYQGRWSESDAYGLGWLLTHLVGAREWSGLSSVLGQADFWKARLQRIDLPAVLADLRSALELTPAGGSLRSGLMALQQTLELAASLPGDAPSSRSAQVEAILARVRDSRLDRLESGVALRPQRADLAARISERAQGNFLYASLVLAELEANPSKADQILDEMPAGLEDKFRSYLHRAAADTSPQDWIKVYRPVLATLAVAREPLTRSQLSNLCDLGLSEVDQALTELTSFISVETDQGAPRYQLYHTFYAEFITDRKRAREFWVDPVAVHARIAEAYLRDYQGHWDACDSYGLRHAVAHLELTAEGRRPSKQYGFTEMMVRLSLAPDFQEAYLGRLEDPLGLLGSLERVVWAAARGEHDKTPVLLIEAALGLVDFRSRRLDPGAIFDLARKGEGEAALRHLSLYPVALEWRQAIQWMVAWLAAEVNPPSSRALFEQLVPELPSKGPLVLLAAHARAALEGKSPPSQELPTAPPTEVAAAIVTRLDPTLSQDEPLSELMSVSPDLVGSAEAFSLVSVDAPMLVAYAAANPEEGSRYLDHYLQLVSISPYWAYRDVDLWLLMDAVLRHPDALWVRETALKVLTAALTEPDLAFREGLEITLLGLMTSFGNPYAKETLEEKHQQAIKEARGAIFSQFGSRDALGHLQRRLSALAEAYAVALEQPAIATTLLEHAPNLPYGFAGFQALAFLDLAEAILVCTGDRDSIQRVLDEAGVASQNIQDPLQCARYVSRSNALERHWQLADHNPQDTIERFATNPASSEFAALHRVGESYDSRSDWGLPLPGHLREANTLRALASAFQRPLSAVQYFHPDVNPDNTLPPGTAVYLPDPGLAPLLAARFAAVLLADHQMSVREKTQLIQLLVPIAAQNPTALDTVLSRLLLVAMPEDLGELESLLTD